MENEVDNTNLEDTTTDTTTNPTTDLPSYEEYTQVVPNSSDYQTTYKADAGAWAFFGTFFLFYIAIIVVAILAMWKVFTKAGKPGWAAIVPFYNMYVQLQIVGRPGWWLLLMFVPFVNIVISLIVAIDLAKSFGKSELFGVIALWLFSIVGYLILAFGSDKYKGPSVTGPSAPAKPAAPAAKA